MAKRERITARKTDLDTIDELETGLRIDEHALDDALVQQPDFFYRVSKRLAMAISRRDAAKQGLAEEEARCDAQFREDAEREKEKLTEAEVKNLIRLDKDVQAQMSELHVLNREVGQLSALKEAFQQRSYVLKDLVGLYIANYYTSNQDGGPSSRALKDHSAGLARDRMSAMRRRGDD